MGIQHAQAIIFAEFPAGPDCLFIIRRTCGTPVANAEKSGQEGPELTKCGILVGNSSLTSGWQFADDRDNRDAEQIGGVKVFNF